MYNLLGNDQRLCNDIGKVTNAFIVVEHVPIEEEKII